MLRKRIWKPIAGIVFLILLAAVGYFAYSLIKVDLLPAKYLFIILAVIVLLLCLCGAMLYLGINRKPSSLRRARRVIGVLLCVIVTVGCGYAGMVLAKVDRTKEAVTNTTYSVKAVITVYVESGDPAAAIEDTASYRYGVLGGYEKENSDYAVSVINERTGAKVNVTEYDSISEMAAAIRSGEIEAMALNSSYLYLLNDSENFKGFSEELKAIGTIDVPTTVGSSDLSGGTAADPDTGKTTASAEREKGGKDKDITVGEKIEKAKPVIFYLSANDTWTANFGASRSDVNIIMVVNFETKQILMINTPRDYYVINPAVGAYDKLTHCGILGIDNSMRALENLYDIDIDNYIVVNFTGFEQMVDAVGGVTIYNPSAFVHGKYYYPEGELTLNGTEALYYARERHSYGDGDLSRGRNHMRMIEAIIKKVMSSGTSIIANYSEVLESMEGMFATDLTSGEISDLAKVFMKDMSGWEIKSYEVGASSTGLMPTALGGAEPLYVIWPNETQVQHAHDLVDKMLSGGRITDDDITGW